MADTDWNLALDNYADDDFDPPSPPEEPPRPDPAEVDRFRGLKLIRIPARQKRPVKTGWTAGHDHAAVRAHVAEGGNFGVVCGEGLAILDVDNVESYERLCAS